MLSKWWPDAARELAVADGADRGMRTRWFWRARGLVRRDALQALQLPDAIRRGRTENLPGLQLRVPGPSLPARALRAMRAPSVWPAIEDALKTLRYGAIQLIVHEGQIVRIERIERIRLTDSSGSLHDTSRRPTPTSEARHEERV